MIPCYICLKETNKKTVLLTCQSCRKYACDSCYKRYFLEYTTTKCMFPECQQLFDMDFLILFFKKDFIKEFNKKLLKDSFEKELLKIKNDTNIIHELKKNFDLKQEQKNIKMIIKTKLNDLDINPLLYKEFKKLRKNLTVRLICIHYPKKFNLPNTTYMNELLMLEKEFEFKKNLKSVFNIESFSYRICECKGVLIENENHNQFICKNCFLIVCKFCEMNITDDNHICTEENIDSIELLKKETRNCPNCSLKISKIDGCDHMWCFNCHCFFDWKTMKILKGKISNPDYYLYLREYKTEKENIVDDKVVKYLLERKKAFEKYKNISNNRLVSFRHHYLLGNKTREQFFNFFVNIKLKQNDAQRYLHCIEFILKQNTDPFPFLKLQSNNFFYEKYILLQDIQRITNSK
jgi:hypothetical protein